MRFGALVGNDPTTIRQEARLLEHAASNAVVPGGAAAWIWRSVRVHGSGGDRDRANPLGHVGRPGRDAAGGDAAHSVRDDEQARPRAGANRWGKRLVHAQPDGDAAAEGARAV